MMATIIDGKIDQGTMTSRAKGGTELLMQRIVDNVPSEHLEGVQIHVSRVTHDIESGKKQVYYAHDLSGDPAADAALADGQWNRFDLGVFVSHWQRQAFHERYQIPYSWSVVIPNAIEPIPTSEKRGDGKIKMIYTSTPHRGLGILYTVFDTLSKNYDNVELDVYSSFGLYGWEQRDEQFKDLFDLLEAHPKINYHASKPNEEVREALQNSDVFIYPSVWQETSCLCLIEAMSAGLICVHSSLAALPETAKGLTWMYDYTDDVQDHANELYRQAATVIHMAEANGGIDHLKLPNLQKTITDHNHNLARFARSWTVALERLKMSA